jgi:hypothetical protein
MNCSISLSNALGDVRLAERLPQSLQLDLDMTAEGHAAGAAVDLDDAGVWIGCNRQVLLSIEENADSIVTRSEVEIILIPFVGSNFGDPPVKVGPPDRRGIKRVRHHASP